MVLHIHVPLVGKRFGVCVIINSLIADPFQCFHNVRHFAYFIHPFLVIQRLVFVVSFVCHASCVLHVNQILVFLSVLHSILSVCLTTSSVCVCVCMYENVMYAVNLVYCTECVTLKYVCIYIYI